MVFELRLLQEDAQRTVLFHQFVRANSDFVHFFTEPVLLTDSTVLAGFRLIPDVRSTDGALKPGGTE